MKKDKNVVFFGIFMALSILSVIYCIINEINIFGAGICVLAATYLFLDSMREEKAKNNERIASILSERLEEIEKVEKALYVQIKKNGEFTRENLESIKEDSQKSVTDIIENQKKSVKILVKYNRDDIKKAAALNKSSGEKIVTVLNQNFEKLIQEGNNKDSNYKEVTDCLDSNTEKALVRMESRMKDIEKEVVKLQQISDSLRVDVKNMNVSIPQYIPMPSMPLMHTEPNSGVIPMVQTPSIQTSTAQILPENTENNSSEEDLMDSLLTNMESESEEEIPEPNIEAMLEEEPEMSLDSEIEEIPGMDLVAAAGDVSEAAEENSTQEVEEDLLDNLLEGLLEEPEPVSASESIEEKAPEVSMPEDPNAPLSPEQIAAMFGAVNSEPEPIEEKVPEVSMPEDPNAPLSPEQIAAMFGAVSSEPEELPAAKETTPPPPAAPADSNKQLSADEIAALFASI